MKKLLIGATLAAMATGAQAADLPTKSYTKAAPLAAAYDWSGFYLGINAGVGIGRDQTRLLAPGLSSERTQLSPVGAIGGLQAGYNWQTNNWVLGLEADIQAAGQTDDACLLVCAAATSARFDRKLDWFGTVRGRVGYTTGPVLGYFTGGLAYGNVKTSISETFPGVAFGGLVLPAPVTGRFVNEQVRTGYTIGSGVEAALGGNWTGKLEYLYVDLGSYTGSYTYSGVRHTVDTNYRENIFRAGVNYRIGGVAAYAPPTPANWSGLYVGGNAGSGYGRNRSSYAVGIYNEQFALAPQGFLGGGQVGYNWQSGAWVAGVEADFQGSTQKDDKACIVLCTTALSIALNQKLSWLGTARGRLGYSVGSTLLYGTAGYAYGEVKTDVVAHASAGVGAGTAAFAFKDSHGGWTVGAGIERPLQFFGWVGPNWTSKTEYLYVDLGRSTGSFTALGATHTFSADVNEHIFRTGLNYHFDAPVVAKY